jgi:hypothetical protein
MPDKETLEQFGQAVEEKKDQAKQASEQPGPPPEVEGQLPPEQESRVDHAHTQDDRDVRAKNSRHKKQTADNWNQ